MIEAAAGQYAGEGAALVPSATATVKAWGPAELGGDQDQSLVQEPVRFEVDE